MMGIIATEAHEVRSQDLLVRLRRDQSARVMPMIGGLLDAWESLPNDIASDPELDALGQQIERIRAAMEDDQSPQWEGCDVDLNFCRGAI